MTKSTETEIRLTQNKTAVVDAADFMELNQYKWHYAGADKHGENGYASRWTTENGKRKIIRMHRVISKCAEGEVTDHINHDTLDNRSSNLRVCKQRENTLNRKLSRANKSGYRGVLAYKKKWAASIGVSSKRIHLGYHDTAEQAARAYDTAALKYFGQYANTNLGEGL